MKKIIMGLLIVINLNAFDSLQFSGECDVVGAGTGNKQLIFKGEKSNGGCLAIIPSKLFFNKYKTCSISNIYYQKAYNNNVICDFGYYDGNIKKKKIYFSKGSDGNCRFVCF